MPCPRRSNRSRRAEYSPASLPGLTPQVGFIRLAALVGADLGQARGPVQSIIFVRILLAKKMDARVEPAHDRSRTTTVGITPGFATHGASATACRSMPW